MNAPLADTVVLDLRRIPPYERHPMIFSHFAQLLAGDSFELVNDHDPQPLRQQFQAQWPDGFDWQYLEQGPSVWRVRIARKAEARSCCGCCGG
ncbi:DUF2249 domain-containing protein [Pelomonas sp. SE-A7]|uniref:DUF2249 domain-containing protein n=1 Tax=Pelomonas sp. SE-A7 TaxID=3054953 RepID=UPI00259C93A5|nr:DUF2249 domain-containing protein [Pelomonas sp. SE-A7]MDM4767312.1 DUF2249 domain-containing protein [Pelomonas sp. SE-A7]